MIVVDSGQWTVDSVRRAAYGEGSIGSWSWDPNLIDFNGKDGFEFCWPIRRLAFAAPESLGSQMLSLHVIAPGWHQTSGSEAIPQTREDPSILVLD